MTAVKKCLCSLRTVQCAIFVKDKIHHCFKNASNVQQGHEKHAAHQHSRAPPLILFSSVWSPRESRDSVLREPSASTRKLSFFLYIYKRTMTSSSGSRSYTSWASVSVAPTSAFSC